MAIDYQKDLNQDQYKVVTTADGPCLVLAGAGSGKTRTLVYRVAYLIEKEVEPENILLVTFTNKAAKEMLERVKQLLGFQPDHLWGGTFHHIGNLILRRHAKRIGYTSNFNILDQDDSISLVKHAMQELNLNVKGQNFPKPSVIQSVISYARNTNQDIEEVAEINYSFPDFIADKLREVADLYAEKKKKANVMDFDDLLVNWLELLINHKEVREKYSKQFQYILVDEYQDTNYIQAEIIKQLSGFHNNVLVVGDDSQSIYSFRAADVKNILNFPKLFDNTKIFRIETNYRSTPQILDLANHIIKHNIEQFEKILLPIRQDNFLPALIPARDVYQQASLITKRIMELYRNGVNYENIAILYRSNFQSAEIQLELSKNNIPYVVRGGMRYFEQAHIKDLVSYLKVLANFNDEIAWKRILLMHEGIGMKKADSIWQTIAKYGDLVELIDSKMKLSGKAALSWEKIVLMLRNITAVEPGRRGYIAEVVEYILDFGYENYLKNSYENYKDRLDDVQQLVNFVALYSDLDKLLSDIMLSEAFTGESSKKEKSVVLSTIHQAKGLEWPYVFIIGLRDGNFPHHKCIENPKELEEERRLFYVAVTRAKDELNMLYPVRSFSYKFGEQISKPSMFIRELDEKLYLVQRSSDSWQDFSDYDEEVIYYD